MRSLRPLTHLVAALFGVWTVYLDGVFATCKLSLYEAQQPLALLAAVRALAEGMNAEFIFMLKSLIHSHFCIDLLDADREGHLLIGDGFC